MEINPIIGADVPTGQVRLRGPDGSVQFAGELVANSSSDSSARPNKTKWTELELYRKTDGSGHYVLHIVARSVLYHSMDGCNNGVPVLLADLATRYLDARCTEPIPEPCTICTPPDIETKLRKSDLMVMAEVDWHNIHVCPTVDDVKENLKQTKGRNAGNFGMPAQILLDRARQKDTTIAAALEQVRPI